MSVSILMVGSEALPFSKTGGLADVLGALPLALGKLGHRVTLVTPKYRGVQAQGTTRTIQVGGVGGAETRLIEQPLAENVKAVLVDRPELYDRESLYGAGGDYPDNPRRFAFLCRAALEYALQSGESFDILHAHDWQAGLAPVYLRTRYAGEPRLSGMTTIFTIHNLAYQGNFPPDWLAPLELGPEMMSMDALEFWGQISLLKGGIVFSDSITTVSPTYAREIQTKEYGSGFDGVLATRAADLHGILNGIDTDRWDPRRDPFLPEPYDERSLEKKDAAKRALVELLRPGMPFERLARPARRHRVAPRRSEGIRSDCRAGPDAARFRQLCGARHRRPAIRDAAARAGRGVSGSVRREDRVRRVARASHRRRGRHLPDAVALRAVRPQSDVQHALRHRAGRPGDRRARRHRYGLQ